MRNIRTLVFVFLATLSASAAFAGPLLNGSFESGFTGWNLVIPDGVSQWGCPGGYNPSGCTVGAGSAAVDSTWQMYDAAPLYSAMDGSSFALLNTAQQSTKVLGGIVDITLSQTLSVSAGSMLSGMAFFSTNDSVPQDYASVNILSGDGSLVTAWTQTFTGVFDRSKPWQQWSWIAPSSGDYTIQLGVHSRGDNAYATYAGFDQIRVPEPATLLLLGSGFAGVSGSRFWLRKRRK